MELSDFELSTALDALRDREEQTLDAANTVAYGDDEVNEELRRDAKVYGDLADKIEGYLYG